MCAVKQSDWSEPDAGKRAGSLTQKETIDMTVGEPYSPYRIFTGIVIPQGLLECRDISLGAKVCLARLWKYCGRRTYCWPKQDEMSSELGVSERTIRSYIGELESGQFIRTEQQGLGKPNLYRMLGHRSLSVFCDEPEATDSEGQADIAVPDRKDSSGQERKISSGPLKSLGICTESSTESNSPRVLLESQSEKHPVPSVDDGEPIGLAEFRRMWESRRGFKRPGAGDRRQADEAWGSATITRERAIEILDWCETRDKPVGFVAAARLAGKSSVSFAATTRLPPAHVPRLEDAQPPPAGSTPLAARLGQVPIGEGGLPEPVLAWNRIVKHGNPLDRWKTTNGDHSMLNAAWSDPDFRDNLPVILERCERILIADPHSFVTFGWLIKKPDNWFKILQGEYDYMAHKNKPKPEPAYEDPYGSL